MLGPLAISGDERSLAPPDRVVLAASRCAGRGRRGRRARRRAVARAPAGDVEQADPGVGRPAAPGAGAGAIETGRATGYRLVVPARRDRRAPLRAAGDAGPASSTRSGAPDRAAHSSARRWRCGAARRWPTRTAGSRAGSRPPGWRSCASRPRRPGSTPRLRAGHAPPRCSPRRRPAWPSSRCGSIAGRCWRWRSTSRAGRRDALRTLRQARQRAGRGARPRPGSDARRPRGRRSCGRTRRSGRGDRRSPSRAPPARTRGSFRTTSPTPSRSSAATPSCRSACGGSPTPASWSWSVRRAAASRRWCAPASPRRLSATAAGSWWSRPARTRATP